MSTQRAPMTADAQPLALTPEQRWARSRALPGSRLLKVEIRGALNEARLRRAVQEVVFAHETLRPLESDPPLEPAGWGGAGILRTAAAESSAQAREARAFLQEAARPQWSDAHGPLQLLLLPGEHDSQLWIAAAPACLDARSLAIVARLIGAAYLGEEPASGNAREGVRDAPVQYRQFAQWRQSLEVDGSAPEGQDHWERHLAGPAGPAAQMPSLSYRRASPAASAIDRAMVVARALPESARRSVRAVCEQMGLPVSSVLQAAWWALLARISGQEAFRVGWRHDCRDDYEPFADTPGVFDKVLPLAVSVLPGESFAAFAMRWDRTLQAHRQWQEHWTIDRPSAQTHLAVGFSVAPNVSVPSQPPDAWRIAPGGESDGLFELALHAQLEASGDVAHVLIEFQPVWYSEAAAQTLAEQYGHLLATLSGQRDTEIVSLEVMGAQERARLEAFQPSGPPLAVEVIPAALARWAEQTPHAAALVSRQGRLTYRDLDGEVNRLAHWLIEQGVGPEVIVALHLRRSADLVIALLAVLRAGGVYLPIDPMWPAARVRQILHAARPRVVLTEATADVVPEADAPQDGDPLRVSMAEVNEGLSRYPSTAPLTAVQPAQGAYLLFTSGSSGEPKGVLIEHRQLAHYVAGVTAVLGLAQYTRFALTSTVAADLGNTTLFGALANGASLVIADEDDLQQGSRFGHFLQQHAIDVAKIVPSHLAAYLDSGLERLPALLILGGEPTPAVLASTIHERSPNTRLVNHYGPTETTVGVLVHEVLAATDGPSATEALPLTQVLPSCEVSVRDASGRRVPLGATGELCIGGAQVCRGYWPQADGSRFIEAPERPGQRLYRSGDRAVLRPEGGLRLLGRLDEQLKVRGFRIEPAEIETALLGLPGVTQAAVRGFVGESPSQGVQIVAFVVVAPAVSEVSLRAQLAQALPEPMMPNQFVFLAQMPRLANGKIDRRALARPAARSVWDETAPQSELEAYLAQVMASLLERERLGCRQDFFAAGGNSLLVIRLVARLLRALQIEVPPGLVFDHSTPQRLASALCAQENVPGALEKTARLRRTLEQMDPAERAALLEKARHDPAQ